MGFTVITLCQVKPFINRTGGRACVAAWRKWLMGLISWWRHQIETSVLLTLCAEHSSVTSEFPTQRPVTWSFDVFFDLCLNKWFSKQSWGWWFETPSRSLWRNCNVFLFVGTSCVTSQGYPYIYSMSHEMCTRFSYLLTLLRLWLLVTVFTMQISTLSYSDLKSHDMA